MDDAFLQLLHDAIVDELMADLGNEWRTGGFVLSKDDAHYTANKVIARIQKATSEQRGA